MWWLSAVNIIVLTSLVLKGNEYIISLCFEFCWLISWVHTSLWGETCPTSSADPTSSSQTPGLCLYGQEIPWLSSVILPINFVCPANRLLDLDAYTGLSLRHCDWGGCECHFRDSSNSFFFPHVPICGTGPSWHQEVQRESMRCVLECVCVCLCVYYT